MHYLHPLLSYAYSCSVQVQGRSQHFSYRGAPLATPMKCVLIVCIVVVYLLHMHKSIVGVVTKVRRCRKTFEGYKTFERTEGSKFRPSHILYHDFSVVG